MVQKHPSGEAASQVLYQQTQIGGGLAPYGTEVRNLPTNAANQLSSGKPKRVQKIHTTGLSNNIINVR